MSKYYACPLIIATMIFMITAWTHSPLAAQESSASIAQRGMLDIRFNTARFPQGTSYIHDDNQMSWTLPSGMLAVAQKGDGSTSLITEGTFTCSCIMAPKDCSPAVNRVGEYFCIQSDDCGVCTRRMKASPSGDVIEELVVTQPGRFAFVESLEAIGPLRVAPDFVLSVDTFAQALGEFLDNAAVGTTGPKKTVLLDAWGLLVLAQVPQTAALNALTVEPESTSCSCASGESKTSACQPRAGSSVIACVAEGCAGCTLSTSVASTSVTSAKLRFNSSGYLVD